MSFLGDIASGVGNTVSGAAHTVGDVVTLHPGDAVHDAASTVVSGVDTVAAPVAHGFVDVTTPIAGALFGGAAANAYRSYWTGLIDAGKGAVDAVGGGLGGGKVHPPVGHVTGARAAKRAAAVGAAGLGVLALLRWL